MTPSAFARLHETIGNSDRLEKAYDNLLTELFQNPLWEGGQTTLRRIGWSNGRQAQTEDRETFDSPGLYLWGIEKQPLYVGITRGSFSKRFSRYIWSDQSQCNLAKKYESSLKTNGISGFPSEVREWYAKNYRGSTVRLVGAVRFAEAGIDKIWFALFPHDSVGEIRILEEALIPAANRWNVSRGILPLLNKQK